jgi:hypothetical protein
MSFFSMSGYPVLSVSVSSSPRSVAGKSEKVASVVNEFVNVGVVAEHREGALVDSDEVVHRKSEEGRAHQPEEGSGQRDDDRSRRGGGCGHAAHECLLEGSCVPGEWGGVTAKYLTRSTAPAGGCLAHSGATVLDSHQLPAAFTQHLTVRSPNRPGQSTDGRRPDGPEAQ